MKLAGKVAIVTGGSRGIGEAIVEKMTREGARVVSFDISESSSRDISGAWQQVDVTKESDVSAGVAAVVKAHGAVDILVNNAGVNAYFDAVTMTEKQWDAVFAVDLKGAWLCAKHVLPIMKAARRGSIVNIASIHAPLPIGGMFPYAAAKSGLVGLTRSMALDYAAMNIRVNAVCPGWTRTALVQEWFDLQPDPKAAENSILSVHPMKRIATPMEVANLVAFVASDEASAITGASLSVDCGLGIQFAT